MDPFPSNYEDEISIRAPPTTLLTIVINVKNSVSTQHRELNCYLAEISSCPWTKNIKQFTEEM